MRTIRSFSVAAFGVLVVAGVSAAQDTSSALLNTLEVRELVARGDAGDSARLSAHFAALAERYTAESRRHASMSRSFGGNPNRGLGTGMSAHCKRLAGLNTQSAEIVRELAEYHGKLAGGAPATAPSGGARFEAGAGAAAPTEQELVALAAKASTPAEHRSLQEYFLTLATRYTADADEHAALAPVYRGTRIPQVGLQHERLASLARDAAKEATSAAEMHGQLAGLAR